MGNSRAMTQLLLAAHLPLALPQVLIFDSKRIIRSASIPCTGAAGACAMQCSPYFTRSALEKRWAIIFVNSGGLLGRGDSLPPCVWKIAIFNPAPPAVLNSLQQKRFFAGNNKTDCTLPSETAELLPKCLIDLVP